MLLNEQILNLYAYKMYFFSFSVTSAGCLAARLRGAQCRPGKHGAVRILRPGFYEDFDPDKDVKAYMGHPKRQEVLLPVGVPVATALQRAEDAHFARLAAAATW